MTGLLLLAVVAERDPVVVVDRADQRVEQVGLGEVDFGEAPGAGDGRKAGQNTLTPALSRERERGSAALTPALSREREKESAAGDLRVAERGAVDVLGGLVPRVGVMGRDRRHVAVGVVGGFDASPTSSVKK